MMSTPRVCLSENLAVSPDGKLRLPRWSVVRNVGDIVVASAGDTTKLLISDTLPGRQLIEGRLAWTNDSPVEQQLRVEVTRRYRRWVTSNPNAIEFRDRWSWVVIPEGDPLIDPAEPDVSDTFNGKTGSAGDIQTNTVAEPLPGVFRHWWGTTTSEEWIPDVLAPGDTFSMWYRAYVWTPPPWSDNANKNAPTHAAEAGYSRLQLTAYPAQGKVVVG
ncbi:hypothetical protein SEA_DAKA_36 [Mycobacterium phage Daka]|uniref:DUF7172 domain-containing protein n=8 Tax=Pegunavirus TaxID=1623295 RepID=A0A088FQ13_9CAUD|nr:hypothetical protein AU159_gp036 [Mycobacterium phage Colbert]YP_009191130.1 hypothetical protein AU108_gp36 [Mycobacterium phage Eremos]YP_009198710.1 hypothetical protein VORTEX_36 [Mycobacterium phage Vortex]YP_009198894.1 hypothetical protein AVU74_gp036 [Mycobacterium phage OSmaximus]AER49248.1 hypothetical protein TALLGRASSMM_36 [Mycobacterium phage TallGrassMM]AIM50268.1 hypothetical protein PBI_VIVALDI_36 [Mycobacterium phage Vivaldi]AOZ64272.1 hypothetical protein SEA_DAFFY_36 [My